MSLRQSWVGGVLALTILCRAAVADVAVSPSTIPQGAIPGAIPAAAGALSGSGYTAPHAVPVVTFAPMTSGPQVRAKPAARFSVIRYNADWLAEQPEPKGGADWECLSQAVYFEARGESIKGQFAVAEVVLNRVDSGQFARSVCGVVKQRGGGSCQFSYVCDGTADRMRERGARDVAQRIAYVMLNGAPRALTSGATYFHTNGVRPKWSRKFERTASIGDHLFYRNP